MNKVIEIQGTLQHELRSIIEASEKCKSLSIEAYNTKRSDGGWSIAQHIEHLLFYNQFYIPHILSLPSGNTSNFRSGWLGSYFTKLMKPTIAGVVANKMKAPLNASPSEGIQDFVKLEQLIEGNHALLEFVKTMHERDLSKRLPISLSKMIKLKGGDVVQFLVWHEVRHWVHVRGIIEELGASR